MLVLYTQGYRVDLPTLRLVETGGIDLNIRPINTRISLNGELEQETNFLFRDAVFRNIIPGNYEITIEKDEYQTWQKILSVEAGQVNKVGNIRLFPSILAEHIIYENVAELSFSPNLRYALILNPIQTADVPKQNSAPDEEEPALATIYLFNIRERTQQKVLDIGKNHKLMTMQWSDDSKTILLGINTPEGPMIYTARANKPHELFDWNVLLGSQYPAAYETATTLVATNTPNVLFAFEEHADGTQSLVRLRLREAEVTKNVTTDISGFAIHGDALFYVSSSALLYKINMFTGARDTLSPFPITSDTVQGTQIIVREDEKALIALQDGNVILWQEDKPLERIGENVTNAAFSPDKNTLMYWNGADIAVYWLHEVFGPPKRIVGDVEIMSDMGLIQNVRWLEDRSAHLMIERGDDIIITELDPRGGRMSVEFQLPYPVLAFDTQEQILYSLDDQTLRISSLQ